MQQQGYVEYGAPQRVMYAPGAIQGQSMRLPDVGCLRCFVILLALLGLVQIFSIQGILALTIVCEMGCCCGSSARIVRGLTSRGCCSLNCRAITVSLFCVLYIGGAVVGAKFLSDVCGIVITDNENVVQKAAYTAGVASIGAGEIAWQAAHPTASAPFDSENTAGHFEWAFVWPSSVCDYMVPLKSEGNGIYYPHPLSSFSTQIRLYLLAVNGATIFVVLTVACLASRARAAYLNQSNMMMTRPLAYAGMP